MKLRNAIIVMLINEHFDFPLNENKQIVQMLNLACTRDVAKKLKVLVKDVNMNNWDVLYVHRDYDHLLISNTDLNNSSLLFTHPNKLMLNLSNIK